MAEPTTAHTETPGSGGHGGFPPFQKESFPSQLFWLAICFVALYAIVSRLALPRVGGILAERRGRIDGDLAAASQFKSEADAAIAAYDKALADARARAQAIAGETRDKLHAEADLRRKALEAELNTRLAAAETQIAATKAAAMTNVRGIAVDAAGAIVARLSGAAAPAATVTEAVDAVLNR